MSTAKSVTTVADRVKLRNNSLLGTVKFVGPLQNKKCIYYGIDLDEPKGQNDGSLKGHYYFKTQKNKGLFVKKSAIWKTNKKKNHKAPRVTVNYKVWIAKTECYATVRWIGALQFQMVPDDIFYGIELDCQRGEHNGTLYNYWYFTAKEKHGLFVRAHDLTIIMRPQKITPAISNLSRLSKLSELIDTVSKNEDETDENEKKLKTIKLCLFKVCFFSDAVQHCKPKAMTLYCLQLADTPTMGDTVLIFNQPSYNEDIIMKHIVQHSLRNIHCFQSYCYYQKLLKSANITLNKCDDMLEYYSTLLDTEPTLQNVHRFQLLNSVNSSEKHTGTGTGISEPTILMNNICNVAMKDGSIFDDQNQEIAISIYDSFVTDVQKILGFTKYIGIHDRIRLFPIYHFFDYLRSLKKSNDKFEFLQLEKSCLKQNLLIFHEAIIFRSMSSENILEKYREQKNEHTLSSLSNSIQFALQERLELLLSGYMRRITEFNPSVIFQVINTFYMIAV